MIKLNSKRAYVICAFGQNYIDSTKYTIESLLKYSKYPVILYYDDGKVNYNYNNLITKKFEIIKPRIDSEHTNKFFTTLKSQISLSAIMDYDLDTIIMLDSDIIVTPSIDNIFNEYELLIENYPIFIRYSWDIVTVNDRAQVTDFIKNYIGTSSFNKKITDICSCLCIYNRNCIQFLEEWKRYCQDEYLIDYYYNKNKDIYYDFNDEAIANALLWKYGATKTLPCNLQWATKYEDIKFTFDFYDGKTQQLSKHSSILTHYQIPTEYDFPIGLSVIPENKKNLWGFHGLKDINEIKLIINEIDIRWENKIKNTLKEKTIIVVINAYNDINVTKNSVESIRIAAHRWKSDFYEITHFHHPNAAENLLWQKLWIFKNFTNYDKVLFLDTDIIINSKTPNIFNELTDEYDFAAVLDGNPGGRFEIDDWYRLHSYNFHKINNSIETFEKYIPNFNYDNYWNNYFNVGVFLFRPKSMNKISKELKELLFNNIEFYNFVDYNKNKNRFIEQNTINAMISTHYNKLKLLDNTWNWIAPNDFTEYNENMFLGRMKPYIYHFAGTDDAKTIINEYDRWK